MKCKCKKELTQKKGSSYTNLMNHIKKQHPKYNEILLVSRLIENCANLKSVTLALQRSNIDLHDAGILFDSLLEDNDNEVFQKYLEADANIVHSPNFEGGIVQILNYQNDFSDDEKTAMNCLEVTESSDVRKVSNANGDYPEDRLRAKRATPECVQAQYMNCKFILPTSNLLERFFSSAGFAFNDCRKILLPTNSEMQLFLKSNKRFRDEELLSKVFSQN